MEKFRGFETQNQEATENREQRAEVLLRFLNTAKNIEPFHGEKFEAIFSDEEHKRDFIENLSVEEFSQLLNGLNGVLRDKKKENWIMDGETVALESMFMGTGYVPPRQEDKPDLLAGVLETAKTMSQEGKNMEDIAMLVSSSLNAIHPYLDANGRTSRMIYLLLTKNLDDEGKKELRAVLSENGRDKVNIDPGLIQGEITDLIKKELGLNSKEILPETVVGLWREKTGEDLEFRGDVDESQKKLFSELLKKDDEYFFFAVKQYLDNSPENKYIRKFPRFSRILIENLVKDLDSEGVNEILVNYRNFKKEYVEKLIGCIADPNNEEYQIEIEGQKIPLKTYFENRIKNEQEKRAEEERSEKEKAGAERQEQERIEQKEEAIKIRFAYGEGDYKFFEPSEIKSIQDIERGLAEMTQIEQQEVPEEQKTDILKKALFMLAGKINSNVSISQEQIDSYVENKKTELADFFAQFQKISDIVNFIENSGTFEYKIHTSSDYEIPYAEQEYLDRQEDITRFLDELFSQSVYYVSPSGSALRLKLFEIKSKELAGVIQPTTEQIFYNDKMVDYTDKKIIQVSDVVPEQGKFVFEITTPGFRQKVLAQENLEQSAKSGVGTISDEEGIYVNIPEGATLHSGWGIVGLKKLKE
jgi:hypothetical protein